MLEKTSLEQYVEYFGQSSRAVVYQEIFGDRLTPVQVFEALSQAAAGAALLDSSDHDSAQDACVYMGFDPIAEFRSTGQQVSILENGEQHQFTAEPLQALREFYQRNRCVSAQTMSKFAGGMIGFMGYDAVRLFEDIPDRHHDDEDIPEMCFTFFGTHVVFDKRTGRVIVAKAVQTQSPSPEHYQQVMAAIEQTIANMHQTPSSHKKTNDSPSLDIQTDLDDAQYCDIVKRAQEYIKQGDAFQIVTSRRFQTPFAGHDFDVYRALRVLNPSPYQFYLRYPDFTLVGSSPERFASLQNGVVETMPIAGTRRRGATMTEDEALAAALIEDPKEMAEHMMLVDLGRNDVGAISSVGTVELKTLAQVKRFSRVMHLVSRVQGRLAQHLDCFDVLKALFPAGTLSGAPKIRAMEIIDELESSKRGFYGGAVCAIDNQGQMDSCITIRTALIKKGLATVRAGAGVVYDSVPQSEADETRHKAQAVIDALQLAQGGLV